MMLPSKKLIENVLNIKLQDCPNFSIIGNTLRYCETSKNIGDEVGKINIYEFAFKLKKWAFEVYNINIVTLICSDNSEIEVILKVGEFIIREKLPNKKDLK